MMIVVNENVKKVFGIWLSTSDVEKLVDNIKWCVYWLIWDIKLGNYENACDRYISKKY